MEIRVGVRNGHKIYYLLFALLVIGAFLPAIFAYTSNVLVFFYNCGHNLRNSYICYHSNDCVYTKIILCKIQNVQ